MIENGRVSCGLGVRKKGVASYVVARANGLTNCSLRSTPGSPKGSTLDLKEDKALLDELA
jgi:hypothetical protein